MIQWGPFALACSGLSDSSGGHFANDASDARRGASADESGPTNGLTGQITASAMWRATWLAITVAALCGIVLALRVGPVILLVGAASVSPCSLCRGPLPYGYRGLGEVFVLLFLASSPPRRRLPTTVAVRVRLVVGVPIGLLAAGILMANNCAILPTDVAQQENHAVMSARRPRPNYFWHALVALALTLLLVALGVEPIGVAVGFWLVHWSSHFTVGLDPSDRRLFAP